MESQKPQEVSSAQERKESRQETAPIKDPRFFKGTVNPLYFSDTYGFLYEKEEEQLAERQKQGENVKRQLERVEARKKLLHLRRTEQEIKKSEFERVKEGKVPFYTSRKHRKIIQTVYSAKEKGAEHIINRLKKKRKERENKSRRICE
ncbi:uncharacterized protein NEMAJ01_2203 [Nematocida major]|uniref:uncharacterized protein n=1 Tax=Nematocida major TaxID=1912982 RepID=UPI0020089767|nr:uncharacterized protein NEMAJ01_2203 [Nematocida major]KAH9387307.1 hypothetical protein NEMAJ01_2203 [Nematocida major]